MKMLKLTILQNERGQSTIELLVTLVFVFGFIFLFLKTALNTTNHFMAHYYVFLSSRSYLVMDNNAPVDNSDTYAQRKARVLVDSSPLKTLGINGVLEFNTPTSPEHAVLTGPYFKFDSLMTLGKAIGGEKVLNLTSESFLLREPTRSDCLNRICSAMRQIGADCTLNATLEDNGC